MHVDNDVNIVTCKYYPVNEFYNASTKLGISSNIFCLPYYGQSLPVNFEHFSTLLDSLNVEADVILLTETWLSDVAADLYVLNGCSMLFKQRPYGMGGGICIYGKDLHQA